MAEPGGFIPPTISPVKSPPNSNEGNDTPSTQPSAAKPLSLNRLTAAQERRLRTWLEDSFLDLDRAYNKRHDPGAKLSSLTAYLDMILSIHSVIIRIPPASSSTALRFSFLHRLTIDLLERCTAFPVAAPVPQHTSTPSSPQSITANPSNPELLRLLECLHKFDEAWIAVLFAQKWDVNTGRGIQENYSSPRASSVTPGRREPSRHVSETMKTMLNSTLMSGREALDEWLIDEPVDVRESFSEAFQKTIEVLEGVEEGDEGNMENVIHPHDVMDVDDGDADPGMFHGFDEL